MDKLLLFRCEAFIYIFDLCLGFYWMNLNCKISNFSKENRTDLLTLV